MRIILTAITVFFTLTIAPQHALAQAQGYKECSAKTCSQQEKNCANINCGAPGKCDAFCHAQFEKCMKTGEFIGYHCFMKGLIKQ